MSINKLNLEKISDLIGWFDVNISLDNKILTANIVLKNQPKGKQYTYYFYLLCDGIVVSKDGWMSKSTHSWNIQKSGIYCVQGYVRCGEEKVYRKSNPIGFFTKDIKDDYELLLKSTLKNTNCLKQELYFHPTKDPFSDFLIYTSKKENNTWKIFCNKYSPFQLAKEGKIGDMFYYALATGGIKEISYDEMLLYSGTTLLNGKLILGVNDLPENISFQDLNSGIGCNHCILISHDQIYMGRDYFNTGRYYVYNTEDIFVISNRYHALLLLLKELDIRLSLDIDKAIITLSCVNVQFLSQNFTRNMDLKGIEQLGADETYILSENGWKCVKTECGIDLQDEDIPSDEDYKKDVLKAAEEIQENVKAVIYDDRFDQVIVDLTGGLDSRVVFAALTNIDPKIIQKKVGICSNYVAGSDDLKIATQINSVFGIPYDNFSSTLKSSFIFDADQMTRSFYLGVHSGYRMPINFTVNEQKKIRLTGVHGEIIGRPYYVRKYFDTMLEQRESIEEFLDYIWTDYAANIIAVTNNSRDIFIQYLSAEFDKLPVKNDFKRFEIMYQYYRSTIHFDPTLRFEFAIKEWHPLLSKTVFRLRHKTLLKFKDIRNELELIAILNPLLVSFPFDYIKDEEERKFLIDDLLCLKNCWKNLYIQIENNQDVWKKVLKKNVQINAMFLWIVRVINKYPMKELIEMKSFIISF